MASSSKKRSSKKKTSKIASQSRRMKKSRRNASKKLGRRHVSSSEDSIVSSPSSDSFSDSDSMSSASMSSSSLEGTYRSRKKGSRLRKSAKGLALRRSSSSEDLAGGKKRKRSRKTRVEPESRKKSQKKKPRRRVSVSSASSDSNSCSTCKSSSLSAKSDFQRHRIKSKENKKRRIESKVETILNNERTDKSPNGSTDSRSRDQSYRVIQGEENFVGESRSRRLKSVITVAVRPHAEEGSQLEKDILKEKAVCDHDNIPASKTLDTSNGRSKGDLPPHSPAASDCKRMIENSSGGVSSLIYHRASEPSEHMKENIVQNTQYPFQDELRNESEKDSGARADPDDSPGAHDLEAILRKKALENLKKFRGKLQTNAERNTDENEKKDVSADQLPTVKDVVVGRRLPELGSSNVKTNADEIKEEDVNANQQFTAKDKVVRRRLPQLGTSDVTGHAIIDERIKPLFKRDGPRPAMSGQKISVGCTDKKSEGIKLNAVGYSDTSAPSWNPIKEHSPSQAFDFKSESGNLSHKEKLSGMQSTANKKTTTSVSSDKELRSNKGSETDTMDRSNHSASQVITDDHRRTSNVSTTSSATAELASSTQCTSEGQSSNDHKNEAKDGADFKEKKMSVMRGGEMVEVSYKVYIPQRSPALARRKLKR